MNKVNYNYQALPQAETDGELPDSLEVYLQDSLARQIAEDPLRSDHTPPTLQRLRSDTCALVPITKPKQRPIGKAFSDNSISLRFG